MPALLFSASLIVSFVSGVVALFAPCCISFLLPAYLGSVLKHRRRVVGATLLFSLGIALVMVPVTLGFWSIIQLFNNFHTEVYVVGGLLMAGFGVLALLGKRMSFMFHIPAPKVDSLAPGPLITLGVISGLTSVCCAPVLAGALTLGALSTSSLQALAIGLLYVAGMVFPLLAAAVMFQHPITQKLQTLLNANLLNIRGQPALPLRDLLTGVLFIGVGFAMIFLSLTGRIAMPTTAGQAGANLAVTTAKALVAQPGLELAVFVTIGALAVWFVRIIIKHARR